MKAALLPLALALAACGDGGHGRATQEQIERLAEPKPGNDLVGLVRLEPLAAADVAGQRLVGPGCRFTRGGNLLLVTAQAGAAVRIEGGVRRLVVSAPAGPSGGFFTDGELSVSVGRTEEQQVAADEGTRWPARARVTYRSAGLRDEINGVWTCVG